MKFFINFVAILSLIIGLIGCGKRQLPLSSQSNSKYDSKTAENNCAFVDLTNDLLRHDNILKLFRCIGWSKEYPRLFENLQAFSSQEFDDVMQPLNQFIFANKNQRDTFLNGFNLLLAADEIEKLSSMLKDFLADEKLLTSINKLFDLNTKSFQEIEKINKFVSTLSKVAKRNPTLFGEFQRTLVQLQREQPQAVEKIFLQLFDKLTLDNKELINNIILFLESSESLRGFFNEVESDIFSAITYNHQYPNFVPLINDMMIVFYSDIYNCSEFNNVYVIDYRRELRAMLRKISGANNDTVLAYFQDLSERFVLFNNICPYQDFNQKSAQVLAMARNFVLKPAGAKILSLISEISTRTENDFYLFEILNSAMFNDFSSLMYLNKEQGNSLIKSASGLLKSLHDDELHDLLRFFKLQVNEAGFLGLNVWNELDVSEKLNLINGLFDLFTDANMPSLLKLSSWLFEAYPKVIDQFIVNLQANKDFRSQLSAVLKEKETKNDLQKFLSTQNLFKFFLILQNGKSTKLPDENDNKIPIEPMPNFTSTYTSNLKECLNDLNLILERDVSFWSLLETYPSSCRELETSKPLSNYIITWTIHIDEMFKQNFGSRFSIPHGVLSSEMMTFYHSLMHIVNSNLVKENNYVMRALNAINRELFDKKLSLALISTLEMVKVVKDQTLILDNALDSLAELESKKFSELISSGLYLFAVEPQFNNFSGYNCGESSYLIENYGCLDSFKLSSSLDKIENLLGRDNGAKNKLSDSLVDFIFGKGIKIPFGQKKSNNYKFDLIEFLSFLSDLSLEKTHRIIQYQTESSTVSIKTSLATRLEIVIREISFLNNFYGAYFMNTAASAKDYYRKVKSMKKNIALMDSSSNFFRNRNIFPAETKWAFKNISATYDSLIELSSGSPEYGYEYEDLIQALLSIAVETSSDESRKFSPFQTPKTLKVDGHNGKFITEITRLGLLTRLGEWLNKAIVSDKNKIKNDPDLIFINNSLKEIYKTENIKRVFNHFFKSKNKELIVADLANILSIVEDNTVNEAIYILKRIITVFIKSDVSISAEKLTDIIIALIDNYHSLKKYLTILDKAQLNKLLFKLSLNFVDLSEPKLNLVFGFLADSIESLILDDFRQLLGDEKFLKALAQVINDLEQYLGHGHINTGLLAEILQTKGLSFTPIQNLIKNSKIESRPYAYLHNIIDLLVKQENGSTNLEKGLCEIFIHKKDITSDFLTDMFDRFKSQ